MTVPILGLPQRRVKVGTYAWGFGFRVNPSVVRWYSGDMLMEQLFERGIMAMAPSNDGPARQVGGFNLDFVARLGAGPMMMIGVEWAFRRK